MPFGTITDASPSFAHSCARRSAWVAGRKPPREADLAEGRRRRARAARPWPPRRWRARSRGRRPGSSMRTPPATFTNTSAWPSASPAWRERTATIIASRFGIDAGADPARHGQVGLRHERLDLEQKRPRALERARDGRANLAVALAEDRRGIGHSLQAGAGHLEHAELVRRAEAVLRGAQDAVRVVAVALELEDAIDEVLQDARPGDRPVLGDVADQEERDTGLLADAEQPRRRLAHLRDRSRRRADLRRVERLDRVDHADVRALALERGADGVEVRLREDLDLLRAAEPRRAKLDLGRRFLAGHEERAPLAGDRGERHQEQRRLPDAGLTADEDERRRDEAAAEHAVELGNPGRDSLGLVDPDIREPEQRTRLPRSCSPSEPSSARVPKLPQPGQRPSQRPVEYPHSAQEK